LEVSEDGVDSSDSAELVAMSSKLKSESSGF